MNGHLDDYFTFLAVVYWKKLPEIMPGLYENPMENDATAYAQVRVFVPRRRLVWRSHSSSDSWEIGIGGAPGDLRSWSFGDTDSDGGGVANYYSLGAEPGVSQAWDLFNQHWTCQLVPATTPYLSDLLQAPVPLTFSDGRPVVPPRLGGITSEDIQRISPH
jgi:hypothetical protein